MQTSTKIKVVVISVMIGLLAIILMAPIQIRAAYILYNGVFEKEQGNPIINCNCAANPEEHNCHCLAPEPVQ